MQNKRIDTTVNGFLNPNCYQALVEIKPDKNSNGLVGQRESAYLKTKKSDIDNCVLDNLISYCVTHRLDKFHISKEINPRGVTQGYRLYLTKSLMSLARKNKIFFTYYNEHNSVILGCRIHANNLKKRMSTIMSSAPLNIGK
jgi:hypothetical protein